MFFKPLYNWYIYYLSSRKWCTDLKSCIVIGYSFALARKGYDNHHCHNKPHTGNGAGAWMTSSTEEMVLRIWGFWKRVSWEFRLDQFLPLRHRVKFSTIAAAVKFFGSLPTEILNIARCAALRVGMGSA